MIQSTHEVTEEPAAVYEHNWKEHEEANEEIWESQRDEEEVGGCVELPGEEDQHEFHISAIIQITKDEAHDWNMISSLFLTV